MTKKQPSDYLALALDNIDTLADLTALIDKTHESVGVYKIGLEQFTRFGPPILQPIRDRGRRIFLDLKFHDIPNTVAKAVASACELGIDYLTLHTQGGLEMMKAAAQNAREMSGNVLKPLKLIGVTVLTSISPDALAQELSVATPMPRHVRHLAELAMKAGLDGIVCSAADLAEVKPALPDCAEIITPGIRPQGAAINDQKRIATPASAIRDGATLLVVGRPITQAADPATAAKIIMAEISIALGQG